MEIISALATTLRQHDITGTDLSQLSGVDEGSISRFINKLKAPNVRTLQRLIQALSLDARISFLGMALGYPIDISVLFRCASDYFGDKRISSSVNEALSRTLETYELKGTILNSCMTASKRSEFLAGKKDISLTTFEQILSTLDSQPRQYFLIHAFACEAAVATWLRAESNRILLEKSQSPSPSSTSTVRATCSKIAV